MSNLTGAKSFMAGLLILTGAASIVPAHAGGMGAEYFKKSDANNDGALTMDEMTAARMQHLGSADADKDGFISASELTEHHMAMMKANQDKRFTRFSSRFDANKDGKVALDEIKSYQPPFFDKADANGDDRLTPDEMKAARKIMHEGKMHEGKKG